MSPQSEKKAYSEDQHEPIPLWRVREMIHDSYNELKSYCDGRFTQVTEYADQRDAHRDKNTQQDIFDLREENKVRHAENKEVAEINRKQTEQNTKYIFIGLGILIALNALGLAKAFVK